MSPMMMGLSSYRSILAASTATFDPANKSSHITLSGGNLIATAGAGSGNSTVVLSTTSHTTGKYYAEFTLTTGTAAADEVGLANSSFVIDGGAFLGADSSKSASLGNDGNPYGLSAGAPGTGTFTSGDVIGVAIDVGAALIWFRKNAGAWTVNGTGNPATGANGYTFFAAGAIWLAVEGTVNGNVWSANFGGSAYAQTPPSGFGNW